MTSVTYNAIRTGVKNYLVAQLDWCTADNTLDFSPTDAEQVFGQLPCTVCDFSALGVNTWTPIDQGYLKGLPFLIELYVEVEDGDLSFGRTASQTLATYLKNLEDLFTAAPSIGGLVKRSDIGASKLEAVQLQAVNLGVIARWAWLSLTLYVVS